jgi:excisionase family DNA binding protein
MPLLETPKQCAGRVGVSERQVRSLIATERLEHVKIGSRVHIPIGAFERFIEANKRGTSWQGETKDRSSDGSVTAELSTSHGQSTAAAASARLALKTANALKKFSGSGCAPTGAEPAQVIPLRSS